MEKRPLHLFWGSIIADSNDGSEFMGGMEGDDRNTCFSFAITAHARVCEFIRSYHTPRLVIQNEFSCMGKVNYGCSAPSARVKLVDLFLLVHAELAWTHVDEEEKATTKQAMSKQMQNDFSGTPKR